MLRTLFRAMDISLILHRYSGSKPAKTRINADFPYRLAITMELWLETGSQMTASTASLPLMV
jgi:hypothetical protein